MNIHKIDKNAIERAAEVILRGGLVAFPTETVYGLGADALNPAAVARIFEAKKRPLFDPMIVHIADEKMLNLLSTDIPPMGFDLIDKFWPGPLTLVLPKTSAVPDITTSGLATVAVRMPSSPAAIDLIRVCGTPIAAPSANLFGRLSPTTAAHVAEQLGGSIDMILDGGPCSVGVESTIVKIEGGRALLLRPGGLSIEDISRVTGPLERPENRPVESPGSLPSHYAPENKLVLVDKIEKHLADDPRAALLFFVKPEFSFDPKRGEVLTKNGSTAEAAINLFSALHRLDSASPDVIYAERVPENGLGIAVMDRLRRASYRSE